MLITRREAILKTLFGAGMIGLRSLATGIPAYILQNPRLALAQSGNPYPKTGKEQYLIFSTSAAGDPVGCNAPGTYDDPGIIHNQTGMYTGTLPNIPANLTSSPAMQKTSINFGNSSSNGAYIWNQLQNISNTCFLYHSTYTVVHPDEPKVLSMNTLGINTENILLSRSEMLVSAYAQYLSGILGTNNSGTLQPQPICLGASNAAEILTYNSQPQPYFPPVSLSSVLTSPNTPLAEANLLALRDSTLDQINNWFSANGNSAQQSFIDQYAASRSQVRNMSTQYINAFQNIKDNSPISQITAAVTLIEMGVSPVISVHVPFGGDNHSDIGLQNEINQTVEGVYYLNNMVSQISASSLPNNITFAMLNVFGRTMSKNNPANVTYDSQQNPTYLGRSHLGAAHCTVMIGPNIQGGVVGSLAPTTTPLPAYPSTVEYQAQIGSTGIGDTFACMASTLGSALGINSDFIRQKITSVPPASSAIR